MVEYYYLDGETKCGPFDFKGLKAKRISQETKVWFYPMHEWKPAGEIPELKELFQYDTLSFNRKPEQSAQDEEPEYAEEEYIESTEKPRRNSNPTNTDQAPKNWLRESILVTLFCCLPLGIVGIINASKVEALFKAGDFDGAYEASEKARYWMKMSMWVGLVFQIIYVFYKFSR